MALILSHFSGSGSSLPHHSFSPSCISGSSLGNSWLRNSLNKQFSTGVLGFWINYNQLHIIHSQSLLKDEGGQWTHWHDTGIFWMLETEGKLWSSPCCAYGTLVCVNMFIGQGEGNVENHCSTGKREVSFLVSALSDQPVGDTLLQADEAQGPLIYGLWKVRLFLQVNTAPWKWGLFSSQRQCSVSEEIPFLALSNKRNSLQSPIRLLWVSEEEGT